MPTVDSELPGLRIGGWIPHHEATADARPGPRPAGHFRSVPSAPVGLTPPRSHTVDRSIAWFLIAIGLIACLSVSAAVVIVRSWKAEHRPSAIQVDAVPPIDFPDPPIPVPVLPAASAATTPTLAPTSVGRSSPADPAHTELPQRTRPPAGRRSPTWVVGRIVSLEPQRLPGYRVRHRDFRARINQVGTGSRPLDRADASFAVRSGLADAGCVSLESTNYPGRYLRHRNFAVLLQERDSSVLFSADATFCPEPAGRGPAQVLRSVNYPDFYVVIRDFELHLDHTSAELATPFVVRPGL